MFQETMRIMCPLMIRGIDLGSANEARSNMGKDEERKRILNEGNGWFKRRTVAGTRQ